MAVEVLIFLLRLNVLAALAIAAVLILREPVRRTFGAHVGYALWVMVPLAMTGSAMPVEAPPGVAGPAEAALNGLRAWLSVPGRANVGLAFWLVGVALGAAIGLFRQARFLIAERAGRAGPAAVGFIQPRLVSPMNFTQRFTPEEWRLVRAHERAHMDRMDGRAIVLAVVAQWVCWFNPLMYVGLRALRLDQELACDATVVARLPAERRRYAETLLKTEQDACTLVFGASWRGRGSLEARLSMLAARPTRLDQTDHSMGLIMALWLVAFLGAWMAEPPRRLAPVPRNGDMIVLLPPVNLP